MKNKKQLKLGSLVRWWRKKDGKVGIVVEIEHYDTTGIVAGQVFDATGNILDDSAVVRTWCYVHFSDSEKYEAPINELEVLA